MSTKRMKTVQAGDYTFTAQNGQVFRMRCGSLYPEFTLEQVDAILARMEEVAKVTTPAEYAAMPAWDHPQGETSDEIVDFRYVGSPDMRLTVGCVELNLEQLRNLVAQLHEINKEPMAPLPKGVIELPGGGYYIRRVGDYIYTCTETGVVGGAAMTIAEGNQLVEAMEARAKVSIPEGPKSMMIKGYGDNMVASYGCQSFNLAEVKKIMEVLNQPVAEPATAS